jgi:hypothetical protein
MADTTCVLVSGIVRQPAVEVVKLTLDPAKFSLVDGWSPPENGGAAAASTSIPESDAMHALLMARADALDGVHRRSRTQINR